MKPSTYIPFWQRVHRIIRNVTSNVAFVWSPNVVDGLFGQIATPGSLDYTLQDTNGDGTVNALDGKHGES